jgi:hypothetical protein
VHARVSIVDSWYLRTLEAYTAETRRFLLSEPDRFRNPVGHAIRESLAVLAEELAGEMNAARIVPALDAIVRILAVQDFAPSDALRFIFLLKQVVRQSEGAEAEFPLLERRLDELALTAFDVYTSCRDQIFRLRANEAQRAAGVRRPR